MDGEVCPTNLGNAVVEKRRPDSAIGERGISVKAPEKFLDGTI